MPLNASEIARLAEVAITAYSKEDSTDNFNVARPLLDVLMKNSQPLVVGQDGFSENIYIANNGNTQDVSGNGKVTYNTRNNNKLLKYDYSFVHDGFTLSEDELYRAGIRVTDAGGLNGTSTKAERVQIVNWIKDQLKGLKEGQKEGIHARLWLDGTQGADRRPGIDALVSTTPAAGTIGGYAASNAIWQNGAAANVAATTAGFTTALAQLNRNVKRRNGKITHYFAGGEILDAMRTAVLSANQTSINYEGGTRLTIDMGSGEIMVNGLPVVYVPDFDNNFGGGAPTIAWTKRLYGLNLESSITLRKDGQDFLNPRDANRPIDQYTFYMGMTSKFGISTKWRNSNFVMSIA
jgi:hypothetical protein